MRERSTSSAQIRIFALLCFHRWTLHQLRQGSSGLRGDQTMPPRAERSSRTGKQKNVYIVTQLLKNSINPKWHFLNYMINNCIPVMSLPVAHAQQCMCRTFYKQCYGHGFDSQGINILVKLLLAWMYCCESLKSVHQMHKCTNINNELNWLFSPKAYEMT